MSARRHCSARSGVRLWQTVTVASSARSSRAMGFPTMLLRPTTTQCFPAGEMPYARSRAMIPAGVQGRHNTSMTAEAQRSK